MWVGLVAMYYLPYAILFSIVCLVWKNRLRNELSPSRSITFRVAMGASVVAALMLAIWVTHFTFTRKGHDGAWPIWNEATAVAWVLATSGALFGKGRGRVLLILAQGASFLAVYGLYIMTYSE